MKKSRVLFYWFMIVFSTISFGQKQLEYLDRGLIAIKISNGVYLSWRIFGDEWQKVSYNIYRDDKKINLTPVKNVSNYIDNEGVLTSRYYVCPVINGIEGKKSKTIGVWDKNYFDIPLDIPPAGVTPTGESYTYNANDCSIADLDGDGEYEIVLKWDPSNSKDNSQSGYTGNVYLDAYKFNGTKLWRIDLGKNIRAGAHYTQFMVYDLDGDGKAEVACKTADGTIDGLGNVIGSATADYRNSSGYILSGPEYFTIFSGETGKALRTVNYIPERGNVSSWGDSYGNRVDRFLACIAYLDGKQPSVVMCRGYYTRTVLVAWDYRNNALTQRWIFDSNNPGYSSWAGQGNHNLSVADVDGDGKDEIIYGAMAIDDNGSGLWNTKLGHGDAMHVSDIDPSRPGLEEWKVNENSTSPGSALIDARTGEIIWKTDPQGDVGRGVAGDISANADGMECWGGTSGLMSSKGTYVGNYPSSQNFLIWWDGDLLRELLDGTRITKYGGGTLLQDSYCASNNGTKSNPSVTADLFGDWREEVIWRTNDNKYLRVYTTVNPTEYGLFTLMHDPQYRVSIAWQNVAYNQPPHTGFFLGNNMTMPPSPNIIINSKSVCNSNLSSEWKNIDIGVNVKPACVSQIDSNFEIKATGNKIGGNSDKFNYTYQSFSGDFEIIAEVNNITPVNNNYESLAGIMIRENLTPESKFIFIGISAKTGLLFEFRKNDSETASVGSILTTAKCPYWLKLNREGSVINSYYSADGETWTKIASTKTTFGLILHAGLASMSGNNEVYTNINYNNVYTSGFRTGNLILEQWKLSENKPLKDFISNTTQLPEADSVSTISNTELSAPVSSDNFVIRLRGYIIPPVSDKYVFNIAGKDSCILLLSNDTSVKNAKVIALVNQATSPREWTKADEQQSDSIYLEAGEKYYIEILLKALSNENNLAVAWSSSMFSKEIIYDQYLSLPEIEITDTTDTTIIDTTDTTLIIDKIIDKNISIYPNPVLNHLTVKINELVNNSFTAIIYNNIGSKVFEYDIKDKITRLNISNLKSGLYILQIKNEKNQWLFKIYKL
jgi:rhamnogalacturonan endolyase